MAYDPLKVDKRLEKAILGGGFLGKSENKRQPISKSQKDMVWDKQRGNCWFCKKKLCPSYTHYDHIKEVSKGGKSITSNLRAVCANCHSKRHKFDKAKIADKRKARTNSSTGYGMPTFKIPKFKVSF
jgi:5-methylcytosine-specific restriction endonuclease McrA